ncbi:MAG: Hsp20/alpha crystallin family protein [Chloroflexi bacterium]|nr:Hsp20/alpha crystallin family protein [Chloroflexota bacterium]
MNTYLVRRSRNPYTQNAQIHDPFAFSRTVDRMDRIDRIDRMVRDAFGATARASAFTPAVDLSETADAYRIEAELPGWKPEQVEISIENGVLTLKGEAAEETAAEGEKQHVREIARSSFLRRFALPAEVDADKATAEFTLGMLQLSIPKAEVVKPKQIRIAAK